MREQQPDEDAALLAAWQAATLTPEAFAGFVNRVHRWFCRQDPTLAQREQAEDLTCETIRRVQLKIQSFRGEARFFTWVIEFAKRVLLEHYQKCARETLLPTELVQDRLEGPAADDPEREALDQMAVDEACQRALTEHEAEVFALAWKEHLKPKQIAERLGITPNAAQLIRKKATKKVYRYLKDEGWL
jgi:RNA polymerase sigma-70 factor (ECF subfamily)